MKKLLVLLFLIIPCLLFAGQGMGPGPGVKGYSGAPSYPFYATVVDNFNDTENPMTGWTTYDGGVGSNGATAYGTTAVNFAEYTVAEYGPTAEAYATITTKPGAGEFVLIMINLDASFNGYGVLYDTTEGKIALYKINGGSPAVIGTPVAVTLSNGDSVGISKTGTTIKSWYKLGAGAWVEKESTTDATYSGGGYSGLFLGGTVVRLDDFAVGEAP